MKTINLLSAIRRAALKEGFTAEEKRLFKRGSDQILGLGKSPGGSIILPMETRSTLAATAAYSGAEIVAEFTAGFLEPLRNSLVTVEAGAQFLTGLVGDVKLPIYSGTTVNWKGENAAADEGAGTFTAPVLKPKRITAYIDVSSMFLAQDSVEAEQMLLADMAMATASKLEETLFGKEAASATQVGGFFTTAPTIAGSVTWDNIVDLEKAITFSDKLRKGAYITNANGRDILKRKPRVNNEAFTFLAQDFGSGTMNGYPTLITNNIATALQVGENEEGIIFGDWSQLVLGMWGALDITVDPFSRAGYGEVRLTINSYFDAATRFDTAFKTGSIKL